MKCKFSRLSFLVIFLFFPTVIAQASTDYPFYTVQPGETLSIIADKFNITVNEIINLNNISNPNLISPGTQLLIPGLQGISGELTTHTIQIGENLNVFSQKYSIPDSILYKMNRLTSPNEVYAGSDLIISISQSKAARIPVMKLSAGQSLAEVSILLNMNPWFLPAIYSEPPLAKVILEDLLYLPSNLGYSEINPISPLIRSISVTPLPLSQGNTEVIKLETIKPCNITGRLDERELHFSSYEENIYYAYQGIHAMADPGLASLIISGSDDNKISFSFQQMLLLKPTPFLTDPPINVSDQTIDPAVTQPEDDFVKSLVNIVTPEKLWTGKFVYPIDEPICFKSLFGNRRSYNNSTLISFHTGVDFGVCAPSLNVYSAAAGKVIFAGPLTVRGNAVFIDHGQGIFSGYFHLSHINVSVGQMVQPRQLIGLVGSTGRVTGPHLHFEIWVNGVQVDPLEWFQKSFPQ